MAKSLRALRHFGPLRDIILPYQHILRDAYYKAIQKFLTWDMFS